MRKTIHKNFIGKIAEKPAVMLDSEPKSEQLIDLVQEMKPFLQEAASELLQPRPESVAFLLKKVLH